VVFLFTGILVVIADQLSKFWLRTILLEGHVFFRFGFFQIIHIHNSGAAFGLFQGMSMIIMVIALVATAALLIYGLVIHRRFPFFDGLLSRISLGMVLGGTVGNLIDRIRLGYVTDFIDFTYWPAFNVADASISVGVILFAYTLLRQSRHEER
jgi:signal peptidase II